MKTTFALCRLLGVAATVVLVADPALAAADENRECAAAFEHTQRQQQEQKLISALESAERCARPTCPALLSTECSKWTSEVRAKLPSLVVRVRAEDGCPRTDARLEVTGAHRREDDGTLLLDPGVHDIIVTDPVSGKSKKETIPFAAGERRDIDVDFGATGVVCDGAPPSSSTGKSRRKLSTLTLALGAVGGGLILVGATLGTIGAVKRGDLDDECKPRCTSAQIDSVKPFFIAGDVFAAFGLLTLGTAVVTFFASDSTNAKPAAKASFFVGPDGVRGVF